MLFFVESSFLKLDNLDVVFYSTILGLVVGFLVLCFGELIFDHLVGTKTNGRGSEDANIETSSNSSSPSKKKRIDSKTSGYNVELSDPTKELPSTDDEFLSLVRVTPDVASTLSAEELRSKLTEMGGVRAPVRAVPTPGQYPAVNMLPGHVGPKAKLEERRRQRLQRAGGDSSVPFVEHFSREETADTVDSEWSISWPVLADKVQSHQILSFTQLKTIADTIRWLVS